MTLVRLNLDLTSKHRNKQDEHLTKENSTFNAILDGFHNASLRSNEEINSRPKASTIAQTNDALADSVLLSVRNGMERIDSSPDLQPFSRHRRQVEERIDSSPDLLPYSQLRRHAPGLPPYSRLRRQDEERSPTTSSSDLTANNDSVRLMMKEGETSIFLDAADEDWFPMGYNATADPTADNVTFYDNATAAHSVIYLRDNVSSAFRCLINGSLVTRGCREKKGGRNNDVLIWWNTYVAGEFMAGGE